MIRKIISGKVEEKSKFWVPSATRPRRGRAANGKGERKRDKLGSEAVRRLARVLNCNFTKGDMLLTLKYDEFGMMKIGGDFREAERQMKLFIRRVGRAIAKEGGVFKWVAMTSENDPETREKVRLHHHLVINGDLVTMVDKQWYIAGRPASELWEFGSADFQTLRDQDDYTPVAKYLVRQARCGADEKKWSTSRNLKKPKIEERICVTEGELKTPKGATLLGSSEYDRETGSHYIRYVRYVRRPREKIGGHKERQYRDDPEDTGGEGHGL